jgi:hypothetical protein
LLWAEKNRSAAKRKRRQFFSRLFADLIYYGLIACSKYPQFIIASQQIHKKGPEKSRPYIYTTNNQVRNREGVVWRGVGPIGAYRKCKIINFMWWASSLGRAFQHWEKVINYLCTFRLCEQENVQIGVEKMINIWLLDFLLRLMNWFPFHTHTMPVQIDSFPHTCHRGASKWG